MLAVSDDIASRWGPRIVDFVQPSRPGQGAAPGSEQRARARSGRGRCRRRPLSHRAPSARRRRDRARSSSRCWSGLFVGPADIGAGADRARALSHVPLLGVHSHLSATDSAILWQLRAPRVVLGLLVGGMLALAGGAYQGVFRNPLVDPYLLGVAAGAGLGATIAIAYCERHHDSYDLLPIAAFVGAASGSLLSYTLGASAERRSQPSRARARRRDGRGVPHLDPDVHPAAALPDAAGGLQLDSRQRRHGRVARRWLLVAALRRDRVGRASCCTGGMLDVLAVGDDEAATLGVHVRRVRVTIVAAATIGTAAVGRVQRADRVRRDHRPARDPARDRDRATGSCCRSRCSSAAASSCCAT